MCHIDMSELEEFKHQEGTMLQTFPKLSATWYYCPRKMPDMPDVKHELLQRSTSNLQKNDGRLGKDSRFAMTMLQNG